MSSYGSRSQIFADVDDWGQAKMYGDPHNKMSTTEFQ